MELVKKLSLFVVFFVIRYTDSSSSWDWEACTVSHVFLPSDNYASFSCKCQQRALNGSYSPRIDLVNGREVLTKVQWRTDDEARSSYIQYSVNAAAIRRDPGAKYTVACYLPNEKRKKWLHEFSLRAFYTASPTPLPPMVTTTPRQDRPRQFRCSSNHEANSLTVTCECETLYCRDCIIKSEDIQFTVAVPEGLVKVRSYGEDREGYQLAIRTDVYAPRSASDKAPVLLNARCTIPQLRGPSHPRTTVETMTSLLPRLFLLPAPAEEEERRSIDDDRGGASNSGGQQQLQRQLLSCIRLVLFLIWWPLRLLV